MKEFDKWFSSGDYDYQVCDYPEREAWKAALEMVLDKFDGKTDMLTLGLDIRNELDGL